MKNFFRHDLNARNDEKLTNLVMKHSHSGYGLYWEIIEMLYENNGWLDYSCDRIAFALRADSEIIKSILNDFNLFIFEKKQKVFSSKRVLAQLEYLKEISEKAQNNAKIKWNKYYATAKRPHSEGNATAMPIKENKIKENKKIYNIIPPTLEMVKNYCQERKNTVKAERFINFYEAKGWLVGKTKMKDWQAAVRNWEETLTPEQEIKTLINSCQKENPEDGINIAWFRWNKICKDRNLNINDFNKYFNF